MNLPEFFSGFFMFLSQLILLIYNGEPEFTA